MSRPALANQGLVERLGRSLGDVLRARGFREDRLQQRLGHLSTRTTSSSVSLARRRLGDDELAAIARFWYLGLELESAEAARLHAPLDPIDLEAAGLIQAREGRVVPLIRIAPLGEQLVAHDFDRGGPLRADHVLGVGAATRTLAALTPRDRVARSLDVGTGNGVQALLASAHSEVVVATDLNERAALLARLSVALNGVTNIDVRVGDSFEPVAGERFDLVVANPPFVVSPDTSLTFRDSAAGGERVSRSIVRGASTRLEAHGTAVVLANWPVTAGTGEAEAPARWVADLDCDSLVLHHDTLDPVAYAERWMLATSTGGSDSVEGMLDRWLRHYREAGIVAISSGAIVLRKTGRPARLRILRMVGRPIEGGTHVERILAAIGRFAGAEDPTVLDARFGLVDPHRLQQHLEFAGGRYRAREAILRLTRTAGVEARVPASLLEVLFLVDGERPLGRLLGEVATDRGVAAGTLRAEAAPVFLELFERGFLDLRS